jgi:hypothetical protein
MIDPSSDDDLDALLAGGRLSGPVKDRIFENVANAVAREPRRRIPRLVLGFAAVAAGVAAVVVIVPLAPWVRPRAAQHLRAKGDLAPASVQLDVVCAGGTLAACPHGATLTFGASGGPAAGVLSAYAEPLDSRLERIWYFSAEGESPLLTVGGGTEVARRAVRVGPEHAAGRYRIHLFLTPAPVAQSVLLAGGLRDALASREVEMQVGTPAGGAASRAVSP